MRSNRIEREEQQRQWEEERRRQAELERLRQIEEERRRDLEVQAGRWSKSKQLREYIGAVEKAVAKQGVPEDVKGQFEKWIVWANRHADRIDPILNGFPLQNE